MMPAAPEMSPTLDDAIRALDGFPAGAADVGTAQRFLAQLDDVRDVPPVLVNGRAVAEHLEGAYQAGVRCADEAGHVLVMSLPTFLSVCPPEQAAPPRSPWGVLPSAGLVVAGVCLLIAANTQNAWWLAASLCGAVAWVLAGLPSSACTQNCGQGDRCSCAPAPMPAGELDHWKARALAAEKKIRDEQFARLFDVTNGASHAA